MSDAEDRCDSLKGLVVWFLEADLHVFINEGYARLSTSLKRVGSVAEVSFLQETCLPLSV